MDETIRNQLEDVVGKEFVSEGTADKLVYLASSGDPHIHDAVADRSPKKADVIVAPATVREVAEVVKIAYRHRIPVVPSGQRTTSFGCAVPTRGGIVLDMSFLDRVLEIHEDHMTATVEGGCTTNLLFYELDKRGLMFPIRTWLDPQMALGAYVATNGNGDYSSMYGSSGENVVGLEVVLPTGEIVTLGSGAYEAGYGRWHRFPGGPDLVGLWTGSVGTLGIVTRATFRILEKPRFARHMTFGWRRGDAPSVGKAIRKLLVYDGTGVWNIHALNAAAYGACALSRPDLPASLALPGDVELVLFIDEKAAGEAGLGEKEARVREICEGYAGIDLGPRPNEVLANPPLSVVQHSYGEACRMPAKLFADMGRQPKMPTYLYWHLPAVRFHEFYDLYESTLRTHGKWNLEGMPAMFAWTHPPAIVVFYAAWGYDAFDPADIRTNQAIWNELGEKLARAGAHPYCMGQNIPRECMTNQGASYELFRRIKRCIDPSDIMNPGQV